MPARATALHDLALDHYSERVSLVDAASEAAAGIWAEVDRRDIAGSWAGLLPEMTTVVAGAQLGAARRAEPYTRAVVDAEDLDDEALATVEPGAFSGVASDGRGLASLLTNPAIVTLMSIQDGFDLAHALGAGRANLDMMVRTQVADAGRLADQVAATVRPAVTGYVRIAVGNSCARCLILAGRVYQWNAGFQRHPRCDCIGVPAAIARAGRLVQNPRLVYDRMSAADRTRAGFSLAEQRAIADGADLAQVVNAHRGMYTAGGRRFTRESTTRRGVAAGRQRLSVDEIYRQAGDDRAEAIRLLEADGYVRGVPAAAARDRLTLAAAEPEATAGGASVGAIDVRAVTIRPALEAARTSSAVDRAFAAEFERITGRRPRFVSFGGSAATAREHAEGLLRGLERFPDARLDSVSLGRVNSASAEYAHASGGRVSFSPDWASPARRKDYLDTVARDAREVTEFGEQLPGWHPRGTGSPAAMAVHEFGHVLDIATLGERIEPDVMGLLARRVAAVPEGLPTWVRSAWDAETVVRREISKYATKNTHELVAEAFADVMMNGERASALSREIFDLLEAEYRRGGLASGVSTVVAQSTPDLSTLKVAQLRALVRERGIPVKPRATRADLLEALKQTPTQIKLAQAKAVRDAVDTLVEAQELLANEVSARALAHRAAARRRRIGTPDPAIERVLKAVESGDAAAVRRAVAAAERKLGLTRIDQAGELVTFDRRLHASIGKAIPDGATVRVVRPGYRLKGQDLPFERAAVQQIDAAELARIRQAAVDEARAVADLADEVATLVAEGAGRATLRTTVEAATGVPAAAREGLLKAVATGDPAKVRRAVTATRTKAGVKTVGTAGRATKFDPNLHTVEGKAPEPGTRIRIVRPGQTLALPSGEVIQLRRAVVEVVPKAGPAPRSLRKAGSDLTDEVRRDHAWIRSAQDRQFSEPTEQVLGGLVERQPGWTARSRVVEGSQLDAAIGRGWVELWRGVGNGSNGVTAAEIAEMARTGRWHMGHGIYGNGVYTSTRRTTGEWYRRSDLLREELELPAEGWGPAPLHEWLPGFDVSRPGGLLRMAMDPKARLIDYDDLVLERDEFLRQHEGSLPKDLVASLWTDPSFYAAMRGYDGVRVRAAQGVHDGAPYPAGVRAVAEADQYVIFNRSVLIFERESGKYDT